MSGQAPFHRRYRGCRGIALLLSLGLAWVSPSLAEVATPATDTAVRVRVIELVNAARSRSRKCGARWFDAVAPLRLSRELTAAATRHARDMARRSFFEHEGSDGSLPRDRVSAAGYRSRLTGENIAFGPESAQEAVAGWLASPGHCENIMDPRFHDIGVGVAVGRRRGWIYWVQTFGAPQTGTR
jgi:uncharacterized protein YkwD